MITRCPNGVTKLEFEAPSMKSDRVLIRIFLKVINSEAQDEWRWNYWKPIIGELIRGASFMPWLGSEGAGKFDLGASQR